MFEVVICISVLALSFVSVIVEIKRLKAVKENTKVYKELREKVSNVQNEVHIYVDEQNKNSISFEELVEKLAITMKERLGDPTSR